MSWFTQAENATYGLLVADPLLLPLLRPQDSPLMQYPRPVFIPLSRRDIPLSSRGYDAQNFPITVSYIIS